MTEEEYFARLRKDFLAKPMMFSMGGLQNIAQYFDSHYPRFALHLKMWKEFLDKESIRRVYDFGTPVPFTAYYFHLTQGAEVIYGMLEECNNRLNEDVYPITINLCTDRPALGSADLVICTECLEHLSCNLYKVREYLKSLVAKSKFLFLSFPCGGQNPVGYYKDQPDLFVKSNSHIREFTREGAKEFAYGTGWDVIAERESSQPAYGAPILNVLMRRPD